MVMRYSFKVAPGVKVRISPRSVGLGVGPRAARLHVSSSGWTGVSSGAGGFQSYQRLSGGGRQRSGGSRTSTGRAAATRQQRADEHQQVADRLDAVLGVARDRFRVAGPPTVTPPPPVSAAPVEQEMRRAALEGIPWFRFRERRAAKAQVRQRLATEVDRRQHELDAEHRRRVEEAAAWWEGLSTNNPDVVMPALDDAMADNLLEAVTVDVSQGRASLLIPVPDERGLLGDREPTTTDAGNPTTKKMSQTRRNELYHQALLASAAASVTEAVAIAPSLAGVTVVVARTDSDDDEPVLALEADADRLFPRLSRQAGTELQLDLVDLAAAEDIGVVRVDVMPGGRTRRLATLDDPELVDLVARTATTAENPLPISDVPAAPGQVVLADVGPRVVDVVTVLRQHLGLDLAAAKGIVDRELPCVVVEGIRVGRARTVAQALEDVGATARTG